MLLADSGDGVSVADLARHLDVSRTVVYRLAVTLEAHALARRGRDGRYRLGLGVLAIARHVHPLLREAAMPVLRGLAEELAGTAHLSIADAGETLVVAAVEPPDAELFLSCRVGSRMPLERTAAGRALLGARVADPVAVRRQEAFMVMKPVPGAGVHSLAATVKGVPGIEAAVGILLLSEPDFEVVGASLQRAAAEIARGLH